eukprot:6017688-Ditylum_brightwellii.AAC.1
MEATIVIRCIFFFGLCTLLVYNCKAANYTMEAAIVIGCILFRLCTLLVYDCKAATFGWKSSSSSGTWICLNCVPY